MSHDGEQVWTERVWQDSETFRRLYLEYFPKLYAYFSYRVGRAQDAEDLVADTFLRLIEKGERLEWRDERSFTAWLFRIAHNLVNDYYRRSGQRADNVPLDMLPELSANTLLPDDVLLKQELFARLRLLIGALSPRRQEVITLKFFGGLRNQEIAEILGLDERTVASHLCRGLEDLHRRYIDSGVRKDEAW